LIVDTHCHLDFDWFEQDRMQALERARAAGVKRILNPGVDTNSSQDAITLARANDEVYAAVGVHPNSALTWRDDSLDELRRLARHPKVVAIGEIGLDYYRERAPKDLQQRVFRQQLELAAELGLPVVIHSRNASPEDGAAVADVLALLTEWQTALEASKPELAAHPGVLHSYGGDLRSAQQAVSVSFMIGITGPVTFRKADDLRALVASLPVEHLLVETDAPFLTPQPYRGKRNEPAYVRFVAEKVAELKNLPYETFAGITTANAERLFIW
jgi:TatD DNase family protein